MNRMLLNLHFTLLTQKDQVIPPSWSPSCNLFDEFQTTWLFTDKLFQTRFKLSSLSFIFHIRPFRKKNPMKILCFRTQLEFSRLNASFRACSKACGADGSADPFPDLRGKKSQRRAGRGLTKKESCSTNLSSASRYMYIPWCCRWDRRDEHKIWVSWGLLLFCFCWKLLLEADSLVQLILPNY